MCRQIYHHFQPCEHRVPVGSILYCDDPDCDQTHRDNKCNPGYACPECHPGRNGAQTPVANAGTNASGRSGSGYTSPVSTPMRQRTKTLDPAKHKFLVEQLNKLYFDFTAHRSAQSAQSPQSTELSPNVAQSEFSYASNTTRRTTPESLNGSAPSMQREQTPVSSSNSTPKQTPALPTTYPPVAANTSAPGTPRQRRHSNRTASWIGSPDSIMMSGATQAVPPMPNSAAPSSGSYGAVPQQYVSPMSPRMRDIRPQQSSNAPCQGHTRQQGSVQLHNGAAGHRRPQGSSVASKRMSGQQGEAPNFYGNRKMW